MLEYEAETMQAAGMAERIRPREIPEDTEHFV